ncbi:MAG: ABC transporter ATP-binding protein/permease [Defluviitaleaceae bacterium]|nr:ABC transporter ATP-binding protein/permease [Defluviitaleaceae bacterium]
MKIFKFCSKYLLSYKLMLAVHIFLVLCIAFIGILSPLITGNFLDSLVEGGTIEVVVRFCIIFAIISISNILIGYISTILHTKLQTNMAYNLNKDTIAHLQNLSLTYTNRIDTAYINQRVSGDSNEVMAFCIKVLQNTISSVMILVIPFAIMITINWFIALLLLIFFALYIFLYVASKKIIYITSYELKEQRDSFLARLHEQIKHIRLVKLQGIDFINKLNTPFSNLMNIVIKNQKINYLVYGLDGFIQTLAQIMLFIVGGIQILNGNFTIGTFTIFSSYFSMVLRSVSYFFNLGKSYQNALVSCTRLSDIFSNEKEEFGINVIDNIKTITLENVSLTRDKKQVINSFNAVFEKGKLYALAGENGSGKTTIIDLIMGMYINEVQGRISYNDICIKEIDMQNLRKTNLSFVEQEPTLINDTIRYNITLSEEIVGDGEIFKYAQILGIESFITEKTLDLQMDEKNTNTSGGEKQKMAILRALYKNAEVMIFDEPTSALDEKSIKLFTKYLLEAKKQKIIIIITHEQRLKDICDIVLYL